MKNRILAFVLTVVMLLTMWPAAVLADEPETAQADCLTVGELQALLAPETNHTSEDTLAALYRSFSAGVNADGSEDRSAYDYDENQISEEDATLNDDSVAAAASAFDLRHVGGTVTYDAETRQNIITGGKSYVTQVKVQNPWGTCWAFGIIAAAETSILFELNAGTDYVGNDQLDLSERHLAWFAKNHIPTEGEEGYGVNDVANQEGEGLWYCSEDAGGSVNGGYPYYGTTVFSSGTGVVAEYYAPYQGNNLEIMVRRKKTADRTVYQEKTLYYASEAAWDAETDSRIRDNYFAHCYSDQDDWSLDETLRFAQTYALEESNILPDSTPLQDEKTGAYTVLNEDGIHAIKSELVTGKAVEIAYYADNSYPDQEQSADITRYINSNYAHFTWDQTEANHGVCIVGWDDDYDASNFGQAHPAKYDSLDRVLYKLKNSGQQLTYTEDSSALYYIDEAGTTHTYPITSAEIEPVREEDGSVSVPAGNGAWIVKNSWGASDNAFPNHNDWGVDGSGYFYLSYYDTSICMAETFDFAVTEDEQEAYDYSLVEAYDYMPSESTGQSEAYTPVVMANVFIAEEDMELEAVSCETTTPGTKVVYCVCLLEDDEDCPGSDSEIAAYEGPVEYQYGGYHRHTLSEPVMISAGQKYAVLVTEYYAAQDEKGNPYTNYYICAHTGYNRLYAELDDDDMYDHGVVNPGESYILTQAYHSTEWIGTDYYTYISNARNFYSDAAYLEFDNFSIKAYGKPTGETTVNSVTLDQTTLTMAPRDTMTLNATVDVTPDNSISRSVTWTSDNTDVAIVDAYGKVQAVKAGTAVITATSTIDPTRAASCRVTVADPFTDVTPEDYFYTPVYWALEYQITSGTSASTFSPYETCRRCEAVCFLWRAAGTSEPTIQNPFQDVEADSWYYQAVLWAYEHEIVTGTSETTFVPDQELTRADFITLLYRVAGSPEITDRTCAFEDVPEDTYYTDAVLWATRNGITEGTDATHFAPSEPCTRAQTVTLLYRFMNQG